MDKFLYSLVYQSDGLEFELDDRLTYALKKTMELARQYPDLYFELVQHGGSDYVVFSKEKINNGEAYEWISRKDYTLERIKEIVQESTPEKRKELYEEYIELKEEYHKWDEKRDKTVMYSFDYFPEKMAFSNIEVYMSYGRPSVHLELDGEEYHNHYSYKEILKIFKSGM